MYIALKFVGKVRLYIFVMVVSCAGLFGLFRSVCTLMVI